LELIAVEPFEPNRLRIKLASIRKRFAFRRRTTQEIPVEPHVEETRLPFSTRFPYTRVSAEALTSRMFLDVIPQHGLIAMVKAITAIDSVASCNRGRSPDMDGKLFGEPEVSRM
jgi:hypothetical protein